MENARQKAVQTIRDEHRSISAVLHGLRHLAKLMVVAPVRPDFAVFHAMIRYIDEFPERLHHPKEEQFLFARLIQRFPGAEPLALELRNEHVIGAQLIRDLENALVYFEENSPAGAPTFRTAVEAYADFHWQHMRKEEEQILPLAEMHLAAGDWEAIAAGFEDNRDPIAGVPQKEYEQLFSRIALIAPAPIGFGDRWKQAQY